MLQFNELILWVQRDPYTLDLHNFQSPSACPLLGYRICCQLIMNALLLWSFIYTRTLLYQFQFITDNSFLLIWLYYTLLLQDRYCTTSASIISQNLKYLVQLLYEISLCSQCLIVPIYWLFIYAAAEKNSPRHILEILKHVIPFVMLLVELPVNRSRFSPRRACVLLVWVTGCMLINCVYTKTVGNIYSMITWREKKTALFVFVCYLGTLGVHFGARLLYLTCKLTEEQQSVGENGVEVPLEEYNIRQDLGGGEVASSREQGP